MFGAGYEDPLLFASGTSEGGLVPPCKMSYNISVKLLHKGNCYNFCMLCSSYQIVLL